MEFACPLVRSSFLRRRYTYIFRTLVTCPFVPFLVVFSSVISTRSQEDLKLLHKTVSSLRSVAQHSQSVASLLDVCDRFYQAGRAYIEQFSPVEGSSTNQFGSSTSFATNQTECGPAESIGPFETLQYDWQDLPTHWNFPLGVQEAQQMSSFLNHYFPGDCN